MKKQSFDSLFTFVGAPPNKHTYYKKQMALKQRWAHGAGPTRLLLDRNNEQLMVSICF